VNISMASNSLGYTFFVLPLELRMVIYEHLLSPDPKTVYKLYDEGIFYDGRPREQALSLYPAILQTNRKIYSEAVEILYDRNKFLVNFSQLYLDGRQWDPSVGIGLLRCDDLLPGKPNIVQGSSVLAASIRTSISTGLIYPSILRGLRHIEIETSDGAVNENSEAGPCFSHVGKVILDVLAILCEDEPSVTTKTLDLTGHWDWTGEHLSIFWADEENKKKWMLFRQAMTQMATLLEAVRRTRSVMIVPDEDFVELIHEDFETPKCSMQ